MFVLTGFTYFKTILCSSFGVGYHDEILAIEKINRLCVFLMVANIIDNQLMRCVSSNRCSTC